MTEDEIFEAARAADQLGVAIGAVYDDGIARTLHVGDDKSKVRQLVALADKGEHLVLCDAPSHELIDRVLSLPNGLRNALRHETGRLIDEGFSKDLGVSMHRQALVHRPPDPITRERLAEAISDSLGKMLPLHRVVGVDVAKGDSQTVKATITIQDPTPAEYIEIKFATKDDEAGRAIAAELAAEYGDEVD